jgi:hypothetical protein
MAMNPDTLASVEAIRTYLVDNPGGETEKALVAGVISLAAGEVPLDRPVLGEALIHFSRILNALIDRIHTDDPMLDWESTVTVAMNVMTVAGAELYSGNPT